jgi:hypothetical protein
MAVHEIAMRVDRLAQLYDALDPAPFHEKSLNADVEAYLLDCAGEMPLSQPLALALSGPDAIGSEISSIAAAVHAHFRYLLAQARRQWLWKSRIAKGATAAGALVLVATVVLRGLLEIATPAAGALTEGLLVLGWVALWRPIEHLVFDQFDHRARCGLLAKLSRMPLRFAGTHDPGSPPA